MRDLSAVRGGWEDAEREEIRLLRGMTPADGFRQWVRLQQAFESQLRQTAELFGVGRRSALADLQRRLRRLAEWQEHHGASGSLHSGPPAASPGR